MELWLLNLLVTCQALNFGVWELSVSNVREWDYPINFSVELSVWHREREPVQSLTAEEWSDMNRKQIMLLVLLLECAHVWFLKVKNDFEILEENQRNLLEAWGTGKASLVIWMLNSSINWVCQRKNGEEMWSFAKEYLGMTSQFCWPTCIKS